MYGINSNDIINKIKSNIWLIDDNASYLYAFVLCTQIMVI